jgi:hypothetical protein
VRQPLQSVCDLVGQTGVSWLPLLTHSHCISLKHCLSPTLPRKLRVNTRSLANMFSLICRSLYSAADLS